NYRPILDLRVLNKALMPLRFRMLTPRRLVQFMRPNDLFITIDLKDAYFHVPIHHRHRRYLRFAFGGIAYQFNALPFGLALAPRVFTKCVEAAIAPLRLRGLRVYNCLSDWLVASHSGAAAVQDGHLVVAHLYRLGFVIKRKKRFVPEANYAFFRHDSRLLLHGGQAVSRTNKCHQNMRAPVPTGTVSLVAVLPTPVRKDGVSRHSAPAGDFAYAAIPNMVPVYEAQRSHRQAPQSSG